MAEQVILFQSNFHQRVRLTNFNGDTQLDHASLFFQDSEYGNYPIDCGKQSTAPQEPKNIRKKSIFLLTRVTLEHIIGRKWTGGDQNGWKWADAQI
ncbi:MAG: hypothetical protein KAS19_13120, partial [Anaerolineales bacterium]|nr:hypothetical protein [Anaerolineales bacterium]